jgi:PAS domain S-box-containing protein
MHTTNTRQADARATMHRDAVSVDIGRGARDAPAATRPARSGPHRPRRCRAKFMQTRHTALPVVPDATMIAPHAPYDRFATILDTAVVGILETDLDGRIVYANSRACDMFGRDREALLGRSVLDLTDPDSIAGSVDAIQTVRSGSAGLALRKRYRRADGTALEAESTLNTIRDAGGAPVGIMAIIVDRTAQVEAERRLLEREALQTYLVRLGDMLRPLADAGDIQAAAARVVGEHMGASRILYAEVAGGSDDVFIVRHDYRQPGVPPVVGHHRFDDFGVFIAKELRKEKTLAIGNVREVPGIGPDELAIYDALSFCAFLAVPLVKDGRIVAYLAANQRAPRAWSAHDIAVIEETAERTWAAVQRAHAEAALREADRRKDEFLATLAHELRNPLSPIRTGVEVLRLSGPPTPEAGAVLDMMSRQVFHMVRLVDDLLDVSRISSGKIHLQRQRLDLRDAVDVGVESVRPAIVAAGHWLDLAVPDAPVPVDGDAVRLAQIVGNLLSNAVKYSHADGRIALALRVEGERAEISVSDDGIGIARELLPRIFDLFSQGRAAADLSQGGLGLGLAISKTLAELHGGTLTAESDGEGRGSRFKLTLPIAACSTAESDHGDHAPPAPMQPLDVLVVDDNHDAADTLAMMLELFGHRAEVVHGGADALTRAVRRTPQLVFCDIGMPGMSGHEVAAALRRMPALTGTLLVAVTGWGTSADRERALAAGFDVHVPKPIDAATVQRLLVQAGASG